MSTQFTAGHALLIGAGADLPNTIDDANGLAALLRDPQRCAYPPDQVHVLTGAAATRGTILAALATLAQATHDQDTVIVFFSGHGCRVTSATGDTYYLVPFGYDVTRLPETTISGGEFADALRQVPAQKLLLLLDCCHAGGIGEAKAPGLALAKAPLPPEALDLLAEGRGRVLVASSQANELSYAGKPYSAFTLALVEALCGRGAAQADGKVRVADLALHSREMVPGRTKNRQHPILHFAQADNFVVAYYAAGDPQPKALPFTVEPEIEPEPGAWRAGFDQRGQAVTGPQTNIGTSQGPVFSGQFSGPVATGGSTIVQTGGAAYVGGDVTIGTRGTFVGRDQVTTTTTSTQGVSLAEFAALLAEIRGSVAAAGLDDDTTAALDADLRLAQSQAGKPAPNQGLIVSRLEGAVRLLTAAAGTATAVDKLLPAIQQAIAWASRLFG